MQCATSGLARDGVVKLLAGRERLVYATQLSSHEFDTLFLVGDVRLQMVPVGVGAIMSQAFAAVSWTYYHLDVILTIANSCSFEIAVSTDTILIKDLPTTSIA